MKKLLACICASERLPSWRSHLKGLGWLGMVGGPGVNIYVGPRYPYYGNYGYGYRPYPYYGYYGYRPYGYYGYRRYNGPRYRYWGRRALVTTKCRAAES